MARIGSITYCQSTKSEYEALTVDPAIPVIDEAKEITK
jgi:hypothetical protein